MRNVVPSPSALSTSTVPPDCSTMLHTDASPSPVPCPLGLVEKNGSKTRCEMAGLIPTPWSRTSMRTQRAGARASPLSAWLSRLVASVSVPPFGMASRALVARFMSACSMDAASPSNSRGACVVLNSTTMPCPTRACSMGMAWSTSCTKSMRSRFRVVRLANESSCWVSR